MDRELLLAKQTPENAAWEAQQDARTQQYLRSLPGYEDVRDRLYRLATGVKRGPLVSAGGHWFQREDHDSAIVTTRESVSGPARTVVDIARVTASEGAPAALEWFAPSPDGRLVAVSIDVAGRESHTVRVIDVETGDDLGLDVPFHPAWPVAWLPDSQGFFIDDLNTVDGARTGNDDRVYLRRLNGPPPESPERIPADRLRFPQVLVSAGGQYAMIATDTDRTDYVCSLESGEWAPFLTGVPGAHRGDFAGDDFIAIVTDQHPRGRIVKIPYATPNDPSTWIELLPETDDILLYLEVFDDRIAVGMLRDLATRIAFYDLSGRACGSVPLPERGIAGGGSAWFGMPVFARGDDEISFTFSTPATSSVVYRYELRSDTLTALSEAAHTVSGCRIERVLARSADGRTIPATMLYRDDGDLRVPRPTVIEGYGNFGVSVLPAFQSTAVPVVEAGGIYVFAHLRGGGEYGQEWWNDGRLGNKQHTFDDLYAIAGELVGDGWTTPDQLAFHGASGGGLTAGVAMVQRPDLFGAVVARSPVLDLLNLDDEPLLESISRLEYGDVTDPVQRAWVAAYSPVEHVHDGTEYPACLFVTGENDPRCPVWESRKMAALLESATSSAAPILLRIHADRGHVAAGAQAYAGEAAEWLSFIGSRIGLDLARNPSADS